MNSFHGILETIEEASNRGLNLLLETRGEILLNNPVRSRKEGKDLLDEELFILGELLPIFLILAEINLFDRPERSDGFLVEFVEINFLGRNRKESVTRTKRLGGREEGLHTFYAEKGIKRICGVCNKNDNPRK